MTRLDDTRKNTCPLITQCLSSTMRTHDYVLPPFLLLELQRIELWSPDSDVVSTCKCSMVWGGYHAELASWCPCAKVGCGFVEVAWCIVYKLSVGHETVVVQGIE